MWQPEAEPDALVRNCMNYSDTAIVQVLKDRQSQRISLVEAAARLALDPSRVRALVRSGQLPAEKLANRWLIDPNALDRRLANRPQDGRPFEPRRAWALLFLFSGEDAPWLAMIERSKLRAIVRDRDFDDVRPRLRRRADIRFFAGAERAKSDVMRAPDLVLSGVSAAEHYSLSLRSNRIIDGYLPRGSAERAIYRNALREVDEREANIVLRLADYFPLEHREVAPIAAVAADLLDSVDQRSARAGRELARKVRSA